MGLLLKTVVFTALLGVALAAKSYDGFKVYKIHPQTEKHNEILFRFVNNPEFDFWSKINKMGAPVVVMAAPQVQEKFEMVLTRHGLAFETLIENVEKNFQEERRVLEAAKKSSAPGKISFDRYYQHAEINEYLEQLAEDYPDTVSVIDIGQSYENRTMKVIKITSGDGVPKPAIVLDGGIHAREWIAPAVALYAINQLVEGTFDMANNTDWYILPVVNPDGYEFTFTDNRLWRKTVSKGVLCDGADPNRNWEFHWMESGTSSFECDETYGGKEAFSEVEARNFRDFLKTVPDLQGSVSFHSYAQAILYPYAYGLEYPENKDELKVVGQLMADEIALSQGTKYSVGSVPELLYPAAGGTIDWIAAPENLGVDLVYAIELPGGGSWGFDMPPERILSVAEETLQGIDALRWFIYYKFQTSP